MDETFTKIVTMRTIFYLIHKTIAILVLGKLRVRVFQTREHIGQTAADQQKGVGGAIQSSMLSRRQSGRGGDSHLEILGTLSRCADARVNRRLNNTGVLQRGAERIRLSCKSYAWYTIIKLYSKAQQQQKKAYKSRNREQWQRWDVKPYSLAHSPRPQPKPALRDFVQPPYHRT